MIDYHIHLERGPYTLDWVERFWDQGQKRGLTEIGITEHAHRFREFRPVYQHLLEKPGNYDFMSEWLVKEFQYSLDEYLDLLKRARKRGIPLKIGIEVDFFPGKADQICSVLSPYPWDFVLGSVHVLDKWGFDVSPDEGWSEREIDAVYSQYIEILEQAVACGAFDVLAHLDVIKVFGHRPQMSFDGRWHEVLKKISDLDLCFEISTAGLRKPVHEIYPAEDIIAKAAQLGIPITIASDAHIPEDVGDQWQTAVALATKHGYTSYMTFESRKTHKCELAVSPDSDLG